MLMQRTGEARLIMDCVMRDTARVVVEASQDSHATEVAIRKDLLLRFYGHEFDALTRDRILAAIGRTAQLASADL